MNSAVIDTSVVVKWIFRENPDEGDGEQALLLLDCVASGRTRVLQPLHWLAEVAAVVTRLDPGKATEAVSLLHAMELPVTDAVDVYLRACSLGATLGHHVFDTLYHAVALCTPGATLVTADLSYYFKARRFGAISALRDFSAG